MVETVPRFRSQGSLIQGKFFVAWLVTWNRKFENLSGHMTQEETSHVTLFAAARDSSHGAQSTPDRVHTKTPPTPCEMWHGITWYTYLYKPPSFLVTLSAVNSLPVQLITCLTSPLWIHLPSLPALTLPPLYSELLLWNPLPPEPPSEPPTGALPHRSLPLLLLLSPLFYPLNQESTLLYLLSHKTSTFQSLYPWWLTSYSTARENLPMILILYHWWSGDV